jgi:hypothetical protein
MAKQKSQKAKDKRIFRCVIIKGLMEKFNLNFRFTLAYETHSFNFLFWSVSVISELIRLLPCSSEELGRAFNDECDVTVCANKFEDDDSSCCSLAFGDMSVAAGAVAVAVAGGATGAGTNAPVFEFA